ncbi:hypothetical protein G9A89_005932 [Geosiphon pyriformis]|nr:hypothetical protein G9A89_005932 [Geosiphon pyriformis]
MQHSVFVVNEHFNMNHRAVSVFLDLGGLLDTRLNSLRKQNNFKRSTLVNAAMFLGKFTVSVRFSDLDAMWCVMHKIMTLLANEIFKKKWFKEFDEIFTKNSSKFHKLELLVSRIVKILCEENAGYFVYLMKCWSFVDNVKSSVVQNLVDSGAGSDCICSALFGARKSYHAFKLTESLRAKKANIRSAIDKRMKSFEVNKSHMIRSVLECSFCKVVLDHLMVNDDLILKPDLVKSKMDVIIEEWTKKSYVAFSGVICPISFDKFFEVVSDLPDGKAAGLSGISNELWKHCDKSVLDMLLVILNLCLSNELGVLTNICPIALIETACKILSKILSDRISSACSAFDILCGDNFSVLKSMTTQFLIFAIGSVNMRKAYDSVGWKHLKNSLVRIKMCSRFICFFGNIYNDRTNWVMTNFGLTNGYCKSVCRYRLNFHFIFKNGCAKSCAGCSSFFVAGAFVDDTIWVGSNQNTTQHIFNIASEFFQINDILINNNKTVVIPINNRVSNLSLTISGLLISITKKGESHRYLGIFLSTESLSKLNLVKAHSDVCFFTNLVLKKAVLDKQFLYLVLAVLYPIVNYRTQFSFILIGVDTIHHTSFYGLKSFSQCQSEGKVALLISFANFASVLATYSPIVSMSVVLSEPLFCKILPSLQQYGIVFKWKRLDSHGSVPNWFDISVAFLVAFHFFSLALAGVGPLDIHGSNDFISVCDCLSRVDIDSLSVYMDGSVKNLGTIGCRAGTAAFFENINLGLGVGIQGLMLSTLAELQAIALALECMPAARSVHLFSNNQTALDTCRSEFDLVKNLRVKWCKVKSHSGILRNDYIDSFIDTASLSGWYFPPHVDKHFLLADGDVVSGNSRHFVHDVFHVVCQAHWKVKSGSRFLDGDLCSDVDWLCFSRVWHSDLHMATGFTSRLTANTRTYLMKALHHQLLIAIQKCIYDKYYPSVLCLYCGEVEVFDHVFSCVVDNSARHQILKSCMFSWKALSGLSLSSLGVLQLLSTCALNFPVFSAFYKSFVFNGWLWEAISIFHNPKVAGVRISDFVQSICLAFRNDIWLVCAKHYTFMEKNGLIPVDGSISISVSGLVSEFLAGVIKLLSIAEAFGVHFDFHRSCSFFSGIGNPVSVNISI